VLTPTGVEAGGVVVNTNMGPRRAATEVEVAVVSTGVRVVVEEMKAVGTGVAEVAPVRVWETGGVASLMVVMRAAIIINFILNKINNQS
jgi:hypothetical protein